ncbi:MAG: hypothetical protein F6J95_022055 [Leptolyngbya sp. SIO1E4]|nr:hypothetical protein [Leptolyngbya sp. SIO1E4]
MAAALNSNDGNNKALFIAGSTNLNSSDQARVDELQTLGFEVTVKRDRSSRTSDAEGQDLIVISESVSSGRVGTKFTDVAVPVVVWEAYLFDDFDMTGDTAGTDFGVLSDVTDIDIVDAAHPLSGGLSGLTSVYTSGGAIGFGVPNAEAITVATLPGSSSQSALFGYDSGATLVGGNTAAARRVAGPFRDALSAAGGDLFTSAVTWAMGAAPPPPPSPGELAFTADSFTLDESGTPVQAVAVSRTGGSVGAVSAELAVSFDTASIADVDTAFPLTVSFADGESGSKVIPIAVVDDAVDEGDETLSLTLASVEGGATLGADATATLTILDDDTRGVQLSQSGGSTAVSEAGDSDSYEVVLTSQPTAPVTVTLASDGEIEVSPVSLTFTPDNWDTPQTVEVSAVEDSEVEGNHTSVITHQISSDDSLYSALSIDPITVTISDNDGVNNGGGRALFIAGSNTLNSSDQARVNELQTLGFEVTVKRDRSSRTSDAEGQDLIVISESVSSGRVGTKFTDVAVPVVVWEAYLFDDFDMTGDTAGTDFGVLSGVTDIDIVDTTHPLSSGLLGLTSVYTSGGAIGFGVPNAEAITVATLPGSSSQSALFGYDSGATLVGGGTAAARRVAGPFGDALSADGMNLFTSAVTWAVGDAPPPPPSPGELAFTADSFTLDESGTPVQAVTVSRTGGSAGPVSAELAITFDTASAADVDTAFPLTVSFADGESGSKVIPIAVVDDAIGEGTERFSLSLTSDVAGALTQATVEILDNDAPPNSEEPQLTLVDAFGDDLTELWKVEGTIGGSSAELFLSEDGSNGTSPNSAQWLWQDEKVYDWRLNWDGDIATFTLFDGLLDQAPFETLSYDMVDTPVNGLEIKARVDSRDTSQVAEGTQAQLSLKTLNGYDIDTATYRAIAEGMAGQDTWTKLYVASSTFSEPFELTGSTTFDWPTFNPQAQNAGSRLQFQLEANYVPWLDSGSPPAEPRLFLTAASLDEIRGAIQVDGSHHQAVFGAMQARVDQNDWRVYDETLDDGNWNYARAWLAREAALLYQVTGQTRYADIAFDALYAIHADPDPDNRRPEGGNGLARAATGMGFAIAYDWAKSGWSTEQQDYILDKITTALDAWPSYSHPNYAAPRASNWVAVSRGAEVVMMLAAQQETQRADRFVQIKGWLGEHLQSGYGPTGWTQEGNGYLGYGGGFLLPAVFALQSVGDTSLDQAFNAVQFWQLPFYAGAFDAEQSSLQFGVGNHDIDNEGFTSALLNAVPADVLPYYQYFYDLHRGTENPAPDAQKFDNRRAGSTWALIYYPVDSQPLNPSGVFSPVLADAEKGAYYFRDRWQDANDILISVGGDFESHPRSWNTADAFALDLFAYGTRYIGGPGTANENSGYSTLLVNGQVGESRSTGAPEFFEETPHGGYVIVDGGTTYDGLGIDEVDRHVWVDYSGDAGTALLSTLDQIQDTDSNIYTWQLNLGLATDDGGIVATAGNDNGIPTFLLEGKQDSYLKGWILEPSDATILASDPLQVITQGTDANIWTVMVVGTGTAPVAESIGTGLETVLTVGNARVYYDPASDRIIQESTAALTPLMGTGDSDSPVGSAEHNTPMGSADQDLLTSGRAPDVFVYNTAAEGGDTITDWTVDDVIQLSAGGFGGGLVAGTPLQVGEAASTGTFILGSNPVGTSANVLYSDGVLSFDPDGTGAQGAVAIATLTGAPLITAQQIQVVG